MNKKEFEELKLKVQKVKDQYSEAVARRNLLKEKLDDLQSKLKTLTKLDDISKIPLLLDRMDKEIELKRSTLSENLSQLEMAVSSLKLVTMEQYDK